MDEWLIAGADGDSGLSFFDRTPVDQAEAIEYFCVRVTSHALSAAAKVYAAGHVQSHPTPLFIEMAARWQGWQGELTWRSLEGELTFRCRHDGLGHISIAVDLLSGHRPNDWKVTAIVMTEAGQLNRLARQAALFFGQSS